MLRTLVLSTSGVPINVVPYWKAMNKCFKSPELPTGEKVSVATAIVWHPEEEALRYGILQMVPSVIQYINSDHVPTDYIGHLPFNRKNLFLRDGGRCMYCGKEVTLSGFTFDHVLPKWRGGLSEWNNIVVACFKCNNRKGGKTPREAGLRLIRAPYVPKLDHAAPKLAVHRIGTNIPYKTWEDYVYWNVVLEPV